MCQRVLTLSLLACRRENDPSGIIWTFIYIYLVTLTCCVACVTLDHLSVGQLKREGWVALAWLMYIHQPTSFPYILVYSYPCIAYAMSSLT